MNARKSKEAKRLYKKLNAVINTIDQLHVLEDLYEYTPVRSIEDIQNDLRQEVLALRDLLAKERIYLDYPRWLDRPRKKKVWA